MGGQGKAPISVVFEIPYFTVSGIQVRYLKIIEKSGYQALPWGQVHHTERRLPNTNGVERAADNCSAHMDERAGCCRARAVSCILMIVAQPASERVAASPLMHLFESHTRVCLFLLGLGWRQRHPKLESHTQLQGS